MSLSDTLTYYAKYTGSIIENACSAAEWVVLWTTDWSTWLTTGCKGPGTRRQVPCHMLLELVTRTSLSNYSNSLLEYTNYSSNLLANLYLFIYQK